MYVRRRHTAYPPETFRVKRQTKAKKFTDALFSSSIFQYLQLLLTWGIIVGIDMMQDVRLEYTWPCWLLIQSSHDTYKCHGLWFTLFFLILAFSCDVFIYLSLPLPLLLLLGSFLVWLRLLFNSDRGVCLPTILLCVAFLYVDIFLRYRDHKRMHHIVRHVMKVLASHSVGYPVVTLCFQMKSHLVERLTDRNCARVRERNQFYFDLLDQALPEEARKPIATAYQIPGERSPTTNGSYAAADEEFLEKPAAPDTALVVLPSSSATGSNGCCPVRPSHPLSLALTGSGRTSSQLESSETSSSSREAIVQPQTSCPPLSFNTTPSHPHIPTCTVTPQVSHNVTTTPSPPHSTTSSSSSKPVKTKEDLNISKLEAENRRLKSELQSCRASEQEFRGQVQQLTVQERVHVADSQRLKQELETLTARTQSLQQRVQEERTKAHTAEKKLSEERRVRASAEAQLEKEKKSHRESVDAARLAALQAASVKSECGELCKARRRDMECELSKLRREVRQKEERLNQLETESERWRQLSLENRELQTQRDALHDEQQHLIQKLREENRFKQDLLTAYHEAQLCKDRLEGRVNHLENELTQAHNLLSGILSSPYLTSSFGAISPPPPSSSSSSPPFGTAGSQSTGFPSSPMGMLQSPYSNGGDPLLQMIVSTSPSPIHSPSAVTVLASHTSAANSSFSDATAGGLGSGMRGLE